MTTYRCFIYLLIFFFWSCEPSTREETTSVPEPLNLQGDPGNGGIKLPPGFEAIVVADSVGYARHLAIRDNGDIYLRLRTLKNEGGLVALRDTTGDGKADIIRYFGDNKGTGIEIRNGYLYYSTVITVYRQKLQEGELLPVGEPEVLIDSLPFQTSHPAKPFDFDDNGNLYINVGAPSNACQDKDRVAGIPGQDPCPLLDSTGGVWRFKVDIIGQTRQRDGYRFATGTRNLVAFTWNPVVKKLYAVMHGRDDLHRVWPDLYTEEQNRELPAEQFFSIEDGDDFGWPYCYYDHFQNKKLLNPEYGGDGTKVGRCSGAKDPLIGFPAHYAPNDLLFYQADQFPPSYKNGAFIAFHGSWNRLGFDQDGYNIVFVPFQGDTPSGEWQVFADDFEGPIPVKSPTDAHHRPCGIAVGPDGSMYVADSKGGRIWRIFYKG